jgi:hypothetical protein
MVDDNYTSVILYFEADIYNYYGFIRISDNYELYMAKKILHNSSLT